MFRNYLMAALRNLARNRLYAAINILGLSVAFTAAILIGLFVRNEFSYDRFIPGYPHVYRISETISQPNQQPIRSDVTQSSIAAAVKLADPGIVAAARLGVGFPEVRRRPGDAPIAETGFAWVDPDFFKIFPLPVLSGDLGSALQQPDSVVITRTIARKYFGRDDPIGETLQISQPDGRHLLRVTAVLRDLPSNTHLSSDFFATSRSAYSYLAQLDTKPPSGFVTSFTYVRLAPNASLADLQRGLDAAVRPIIPIYTKYAGGASVVLNPVPIAAIHLSVPGLGGLNAKPAGDRAATYAIAVVGLLVVLIASINFITLMTARASRRAVEVGVRKAAGARRSDLIVQFMGEAMIYVVLSMLLALALAAVLTKPFSAFLQRGLSLDFIHVPMLAPAIVGATVVVGVAAGLYPALVLSAFRPATVLKGGLIQTGGSSLARQALVVTQFAVLVGLILTTVTLYRQTTYALKQGIGGDKDSRIVSIWSDCKNAFPDEVRRLPGVDAAACSTAFALSNSMSARLVYAVGTPGGQRVNFDIAPVDFGFFEVFDIKPLAGRLFSRSHPGDGVLSQPKTTAQPPVIINETAARKLGYSTPGAAVGHQMFWQHYISEDPTPYPSEIVGVVPDMPANIRAPTDPTFYIVAPLNLQVLSVRMTGRDMPGAIRAIERTWKATGNTTLIHEVFLARSRLALYLDIITQSVTIAICALLAVVIAGLGLFALSAYTTERRTKEIGIRKVMGASTFDVVRLLMWQFTIPVLWAIVIACPVGFLILDHWLHGFAYHVDLSVWTFVLAAGAALVIAWITVSFQSFMVARAKPVGALRYE